METILVTGGAGFLGSWFVRHWLATGGGRVVVLDKLTYAGSRASLASVENDSRLVFRHGDIGDGSLVAALLCGIPAAGDRQFRGRDARRPFDRRAVAVCGDQCRRHLAAVGAVARLLAKSGGDRAAGVSLLAHFDGRSVRPDRGATPGDGALAVSAQLALRGVESGGRSFRALVSSHVRLPVAVGASVEQLRAVSVSRKARSAGDSQRGGGQDRCRFTATASNRATGSSARICAGRSALVLEQGEPGESYNVASGVERTNESLVRQICELVDRPAAATAAAGERRPNHARRRSAGPRSALCARDAKIRNLGWSPRTRSGSRSRRNGPLVSRESRVGCRGDREIRSHAPAWEPAHNR